MDAIQIKWMYTKYCRESLSFSPTTVAVHCITESLSYFKTLCAFQIIITVLPGQLGDTPDKETFQI